MALQCNSTFALNSWLVIYPGNLWENEQEMRVEKFKHQQTGLGINYSLRNRCVCAFGRDLHLEDVHATQIGERKFRFYLFWGKTNIGMYSKHTHWLLYNLGSFNTTDIVAKDKVCCHDRLCRP